MNDYGAEGDGTTDDTAAIRAAENAADDTGGVVFFPPGRYRVTDTIDMNSVSVLGAGSKAVTIFSSTDIGVPILQWDEAEGVSVRGVSVTGRQTSAGFNGDAERQYAGMKFIRCTRVLVQDCNLANLTQGVWMYSTNNFHVLDNTFTGCFDPDDGNPTHSNYSSAIRVGLGGGCHDGWIARNWVYHWNAGVTLSSTSCRVKIEKNMIRHCCENGIYVASGHDCIAEGNLIESVLGVGVKMRGNGHRIIGNIVRDAGFRAGGVGTGGGVRITGIVDTTDYSGGVIADNIIDGTVSYGILVGTECRKFENFTVSGNSLNNCGNPALADNYGLGICISAGTSHGVVSNNVIQSDNASADKGALALVGTSVNKVNDVVITGNTFVDCNDDAIVAQHTNRITLTNNHFSEIPGNAVRWQGSENSNRNWHVANNDGNNLHAAGTEFLYASGPKRIINSRIAANWAVGKWTTVTTTNVDAGPGNTGFFNDADEVPEPAEGRFMALTTIIKTVDLDDDASTDNYRFDDDAANTTKQTITLTNVLPAYAELISCQVRCFETVTGSASMLIELGATSDGAELLTGSPDAVNDIITTAAGTTQALGATNATRSLYLSGTPAVNWNTLDAGRWSVMLTYIDYGAVHSQRSP